MRLVERTYDVQAIASRSIDEASVIDYFEQSDLGYRLFHCNRGAMHVALNCQDGFDRQGYLGQVDLIAEHAGRISACRVLEIGCGNGFNTLHLARRMPDCEWVGLDLLPAHIEKAQHDARTVDNLAYEVGSFQQLPFADASFDLLFAVECLCQATDMTRALAEAARVLRPGGHLLVIDCFRSGSLVDCDVELKLAAQLVEKTMAVNAFAELDTWLKACRGVGLRLSEQTDLSAGIDHNLQRFHSMASRFFRLPRIAQTLAKAFPPRLLENAISGLLMTFTVSSGVHRYYLNILERE